MIETYLTANEAGKILKTSGAAVRAMIRAGQLPAAYIGRKWLIDPADLQAVFAAARTKNTQRHTETRT